MAVVQRKADFEGKLTLNLYRI